MSLAGPYPDWPSRFSFWRCRSRPVVMGRKSGGREDHHTFPMPCSFLTQSLVPFSWLRDEIFSRVKISLSPVTCSVPMGRLTCHQPLEVQAPSSLSLSNIHFHGYIYPALVPLLEPLILLPQLLIFSPLTSRPPCNRPSSIPFP